MKTEEKIVPHTARLYRTGVVAMIGGVPVAGASCSSCAGGTEIEVDRVPIYGGDSLPRRARRV